MRDFITPIGGFLVIGAVVGGFYAIDAWWAQRIRAQVEEREARDAIEERERDFLRYCRRLMARPSPVALELHGSVTPEEVADFLIWDSGCSTPRAEG